VTPRRVGLPDLLRPFDVCELAALARVSRLLRRFFLFLFSSSLESSLEVAELRSESDEGERWRFPQHFPQVQHRQQHLKHATHFVRLRLRLNTLRRQHAEIVTTPASPENICVWTQRNRFACLGMESGRYHSKLKECTHDQLFSGDLAQEIGALVCDVGWHFHA
jgi:hypothetical protein